MLPCIQNEQNKGMSLISRAGVACHSTWQKNDQMEGKTIHKLIKTISKKMKCEIKSTMYKTKM